MSKTEATLNGDSQWPLWEVFVQGPEGEPHSHAGSLHAPDAALALQNARDVYSRRGGVSSIWVVPAKDIIASSSAENGLMFEPMDSKVYRHAQFYKVPRGVKNL
ncbi:MAG: 1,2-phenylacetyl-CoA epoxidase subunit B [Oligoflexia bacterium]|nr:1,2-phenylacetyl-CoA epoxidase subunit B [Oligoflexia bacterium]